MRLPFLQVAMEVLEQAAPTLAVLLGEDEDRMLGMLTRFFSWAISRCPEDRPPSASAVVPGPTAALLIARGARYQGDAERFVEACMQVLPDPLLQRVEGGIRICGLSRYDAYWRKCKPAAAKAWDEGLERTRVKPAPSSEQFRPEVAPELEHQKKKKIQTQIVDPSSSGAFAETMLRCVELKAAKYPDVIAEPDYEIRTPFEQAYREAIRQKPPVTPDWFVAGFEHFLEDPFWSSQDSPCPVVAFCKHWRKHVNARRRPTAAAASHPIVKVVPKPGGAAV